MVSFSSFLTDRASPRFVSAHTASRDPPVSFPSIQLASDVECLPVTPNHSSDDELIRGDSATIVSLQLPAVSVTGADWRIYDTSGGGSVLSALRTSAFALRSRGPQQEMLRCEFTSCVGPPRATELRMRAYVNVTEAGSRRVIVTRSARLNRIQAAAGRKIARASRFTANRSHASPSLRVRPHQIHRFQGASCSFLHREIPVLYAALWFVPGRFMRRSR